jgi:protein TonB
MQLDLPTPTLSPIHVAVRPQPAPAPPRPAAPAPAPAEAPAALSGPMEADQVDQQPREMPDNPQPRYPQRERRLGVEASVTVRILIDTQGRVEDVQLISGPAAFADTVVATVRRWRFTPARDRGRPVKVWGVKTFRFELQE